MGRHPRTPPERTDWVQDCQQLDTASHKIHFKEKSERLLDGAAAPLQTFHSGTVPAGYEEGAHERQQRVCWKLREVHVRAFP